jgi:hypothetical protein
MATHSTCKVRLVKNLVVEKYRKNFNVHDYMETLCIRKKHVDEEGVLHKRRGFYHMNSLMFQIDTATQAISS